MAEQTDRHQPDEGGKVQLLPAAQLGRGERVVVERDRIRLEGLDQDAPGRVSAPRTSATWMRSCTQRSAARKSGKCNGPSASRTPPGSRRESRVPSPTICVPTRTSSSRRAKRASSAAGLAGPPRHRDRAAHPRPGHHRFQLLLDLLRSAPEREQPCAPAAGAWPRGPSFVPAEMAAEALAAGAVQHQRETEQLGQPTAAPQEAQRRVRVWPRRFRNRMACSRRASVSRSAPASSGVSKLVRNATLYHGDHRQGPRLDALRQAPACAAFLPGRAAASSSEGVALPRTATACGLLRADQRQIARMVSEPLLLLVRGARAPRLRRGFPSCATGAQMAPRAPTTMPGATLPDAAPLSDPFRRSERPE